MVVGTAEGTPAAAVPVILVGGTPVATVIGGTPGGTPDTAGPVGGAPIAGGFEDAPELGVVPPNGTGGAPAGGNGVFPGVVVMIDTLRAVHLLVSLLHSGQ
jgi:hypothetical protein